MLYWEHDYRIEIIAKLYIDKYITMFSTSPKFAVYVNDKPVFKGTEEECKSYFDCIKLVVDDYGCCAKEKADFYFNRSQANKIKQVLKEKVRCTGVSEVQPSLLRI